MDRLLSPKDLAAAIGVSESSLKRWADEGLIRVTRTAGGHRRILLNEALNFIRATGAVLVRPEALGISGLAAGAVAPRGGDPDQFIVQAVIAGDLAAARSTLLARYLEGVALSALCDGPLTQALHLIGEAWKQGPAGIHAEHRATDVCIHSLNFIRSFLPVPGVGAPLALGASPAGDPYQVPTLMAATVLASEGCREINLGPNLPFAALSVAVAQHKPMLVWISFTSAEAVKPALRELALVENAAERVGAQLVLGGQALPEGPAGARAAHVHSLASMQALAAFARGLLASRTPPAQPVVPAPAAVGSPDQPA
jgi:MerR family transcriptional regulator, light-induced transcriptional regulator